MNEDSQQLRRYVHRLAPTLQGDPDSSKVRNLAETVAKAVDRGGRLGLMKLAHSIPQGQTLPTTFNHRAVRRLGVGKPTVLRDEHTDVAVETFLEGVESAISQIEQWETDVASNATLPRDDRRELALRTIAAIDQENGGDAMWFDDVRWRGSLSVADARDALEHWLEHGTIRSALTDEPDGIHLFRLTSRGRDRAAKGPSQETGLTLGGDVHFHQHGAGSIQQLGSGNVANVHQQVAIRDLTQAISTIRSQLHEYPEAQRQDIGEQLAVIEEEAQNPEPRPNRIKAAFRAILSITHDVADAVSPVIQAAVAGAIIGGIAATGG